MIFRVSAWHVPRGSRESRMERKGRYFRIGSNFPWRSWDSDFGRSLWVSLFVFLFNDTRFIYFPFLGHPAKWTQTSHVGPREIARFQLKFSPWWRTPIAIKITRACFPFNFTRGSLYAKAHFFNNLYPFWLKNRKPFEITFSRSHTWSDGTVSVRWRAVLASRVRYDCGELG